MRKQKAKSDFYVLLRRFVRRALADAALKADPRFQERKWLAEADVVCVTDPATGERRILHGMDVLHRSVRDQPSLNLVMITVDLGSAGFASLRALVKAVKGHVPPDPDQLKDNTVASAT